MPCSKQAPAKRNRRIKGITRDARKLGVSRQHLQEVLSGKRISEPLKARYDALVASRSN